MNSIFSLLYFNKSVLSGAMDMLVVKQPNNSFKTTPLRVRFSQFQILKAKEKIVQLTVNGVLIDIPLRLSEHGEVYTMHENHKRTNENHTNGSMISLSNSIVLSDGYLSSSEMSAPSSPKVEKQSKADSSSRERKISYDVIIRTENKIQITNESSFSIDRQYDKPAVKTASSSFSSIDQCLFSEMKIELSNCWHSISKNKDNKTFNLEEHFKATHISKEEFTKDPWKVINNSNLAIKYDKHIYTWKVIAPIIISKLAYRSVLPEESLRILTQQEMGYLLWKTIDKNAYKIDISKIDQISPISSPIATLTPEEKFSKEKELLLLLSQKKLHPIHTPFRKSYTLSSNQIVKMNLLPGKNNVTFNVTSMVQGKQELSAEIYLWNYDDKIIVSDLDGTITRTDLLGQIITLFGKDWAHKKIAKLYQDIEKNGYKILYVTARTMCVHVKTKNYLNSINQNNLTMPNGPLLMSPDGLVSALKQEIIDRTPQSFKIDCLTQVLNLFPEDINPFYSGIGNKKTDALSYETVGINKQKIFIINEKGEISTANNCYRTSYEEMDELVDELFPYVKGYNTFFYDLSYYTPPIKDIKLSDLF